MILLGLLLLEPDGRLRLPLVDRLVFDGGTVRTTVINIDVWGASKLLSRRASICAWAIRPCMDRGS